MNSAWIAAFQAVAVALIVLCGQVIVARLSNKAQEEPVKVDSQSEATKAWQDYAHEMKDRLGNVEERLSAAEMREADNRRRISALERLVERDKELIRRLVDRLRRAINEIRRLGGEVPDGDSDLTEMAQLRLDMAEENDYRDAR